MLKSADLRADSIQINHLNVEDYLQNKQLKEQHYRKCLGSMMDTMDIHLTPDLEKFVQCKLDTGHYGSALKVVGKAVRILEEHYQNHMAGTNDIRSKSALGLESLRNGKGLDRDVVFDRIEDEFKISEPCGRTMEASLDLAEIKLYLIEILGIVARSVIKDLRQAIAFFIQRPGVGDLRKT